MAKREVWSPVLYDGNSLPAEGRNCHRFWRRGRCWHIRAPSLCFLLPQAMNRYHSKHNVENVSSFHQMSNRRLHEHSSSLLRMWHFLPHDQDWIPGPLSLVGFRQILLEPRAAPSFGAEPNASTAVALGSQPEPQHQHIALATPRGIASSCAALRCSSGAKRSTSSRATFPATFGARQSCRGPVPSQAFRSFSGPCKDCWVQQ